MCRDRGLYALGGAGGLETRRTFNRASAHKYLLRSGVGAGVGDTQAAVQCSKDFWPINRLPRSPTATLRRSSVRHDSIRHKSLLDIGGG